MSSYYNTEKEREKNKRLTMLMEEMAANPKPEINTMSHQVGAIWKLTNDELGISVHAESLAELLKELQIYLRVLHDEYVLAPDDTLTEGARELKEKVIILNKE